MRVLITGFHQVVDHHEGGQEGVAPEFAPQDVFQLRGGHAHRDLAAGQRLIAFPDAHVGHHHHGDQEEGEQVQQMAAELLVKENADHHHGQNDGCGELVELTAEHVTEQHQDGAHDDRVGHQRHHALEALGQCFGERSDAGRRGARELAVDKEQEQAQEEDLIAGGEQLGGGHALVERGDDDHQQTGTQHHAHGTGHGGGGQSELLAGAHPDQFLIDRGTRRDNEDTGSAGISGGDGGDRQDHETHQFRRHLPGPQDIEHQMRQLGLLEQHADPDIQRQIQEQGGQLHHHVQIDADAVVIALAGELRRRGQRHKAVQRDGQERLGPGAAGFQILGRSDQLINRGRRQ